MRMDSERKPIRTRTGKTRGLGVKSRFFDNLLGCRTLMKVLVFVHMLAFDRIPSLESTTLCTSMKYLYYSYNIPQGVLSSKSNQVRVDTATLCKTEIIICAHVEICGHMLNSTLNIAIHHLTSRRICASLSLC